MGGILGGWCANCRNPGKQQNTHTTPNFALAMLIIDFVGVSRGFRGLILCSSKRFCEQIILKTKEGVCTTYVTDSNHVGNGQNTVSRVLFRRRELTDPHWVLGQTRWVLRKTRWVRFGTQIIGWEEFTEFSPRNSVSAEKLTELGVWNRAPRNRIRPVSDHDFDGSSCREILSPFGPRLHSVKIALLKIAVALPPCLGASPVKRSRKLVLIPNESRTRLQTLFVGCCRHCHPHKTWLQVNIWEYVSAFVFVMERQINGCVFFTYSWGLLACGSSSFTNGGGTASKKDPI